MTIASSLQSSSLQICRAFMVAVAMIATTFDMRAQDAGAASGPELERGEIVDGVYKLDEFGWSMKIPEGWQVMALAKAKNISEEGKENIEEITGKKADAKGWIQLLGLEAGEFNKFKTTLTPFDPEEKGDWLEMNISQRQLLIEAFESQGIQVKATEIVSEMIDEKEFKVFRIGLFAPSGQKVLEQALYACQIKGYHFAATIAFQNEESGEAILNAWKASTFKDVK